MHMVSGLAVLGELNDALTIALTLLTTFITLVTCCGAAAVAATIVNPDVPASPFDDAYPVWGRWAWVVFLAGTLVGPVTLGLLVLSMWGYLLGVAIVFVVALGGLAVLRIVARRS
jgi:hypothetical protein